MNRITLSCNPDKLVSHLTLPAIASKSHAHRLLIAAALSRGMSPTNIRLNSTSRDIEATISCLRSLGAETAETSDGLQIHPIPRHSVSCPRQLDCGESGSTLRFLLPVIPALGISAELSLHGRLPERPLSPLYEELQRHGVRLSPQGSNPLSVSGQLTGGDFSIAGNISSQFITGLLLALPALAEKSRIQVTGGVQSRPYIDITLEVLRTFGVTVQEDSEKAVFTIPAETFYQSPGTVTVTGDWSNAAFFLAAGALLKTPVTVTGLDPASRQGDKAILKILAEFGARVTVSPLREDPALSAVTVQGGNLHGINIDASNIPDLIPILSLVASLAKGTTVIHHIERLRIKESDRVASILNTLHALHGNVRVEDAAHSAFHAESLVIQGVPALSGGICDSFNDHRIAMTAAIASLRSKGPVTILQPEAVQKSYPDFYRDFSSFNVSSTKA